MGFFTSAETTARSSSPTRCYNFEVNTSRRPPGPDKAPGRQDSHQRFACFITRDSARSCISLPQLWPHFIHDARQWDYRSQGRKQRRSCSREYLRLEGLWGEFGRFVSRKDGGIWHEDCCAAMMISVRVWDVVDLGLSFWVWLIEEREIFFWFWSPNVSFICGGGDLFVRRPVFYDCRFQSGSKITTLNPGNRLCILQLHQHIQIRGTLGILINMSELRSKIPLVFFSQLSAPMISPTQVELTSCQRMPKWMKGAWEWISHHNSLHRFS